jgi:hypothetical protein
MNKNNFEDNVLLKIKRQYSLNESVNFLIQQNNYLVEVVKKLKFENGQQKSEIQHLENTIINLNKTNDNLISTNKIIKEELSKLKQMPPVPIEVKINKKVIELKDRVTSEKEKYLTLNKRHNELLAKYYKLVKELENGKQ